MDTAISTTCQIGRCLQGTARYFSRRHAPARVPRLPEASQKNQARLLVNGSETLPEMLAMIASAEHSIRWQVMLFHPDEIGRMLAEALAEAARRGVAVQLSFGIGQSAGGTFVDRVPQDVRRRSQQQMRALLSLLRGAGADVRDSQPGLRLSPAAGPRARRLHGEFLRGACIPANHYDHRKILVIDGRAALIGGMNVGRHYLFQHALDPALTMPEETRRRREQGLPEAWDKWYDVSARFDGPVAAQIAAAFDWRWEALGGPPLPGSPAPALGQHSVQFLQQGPGRTEIGARFFQLVAAARDAIWAASPFISYAPALEALCAAARRGVQVNLITPGAYQEMPISGAIFHDFVPELLAAGVSVYYNDQRMAHTKLLVVDGRQVLVGSFNLNYRSFLHDLEAAALVEDGGFAESVLARVFQPYLSISRKVYRAGRSARSLVHWFVRPFS